MLTGVILRVLLVLGASIYSARGPEGPAGATGPTGPQGPAGTTLAGELLYTPAVAADWVDPDPATCAEAMDDLAARATALEAESTQPADATLTALAGLSWSSGVGLVQMTAADTFSLLTVGSSANNILQLNGSGAIPATVTTALTDTWDIDYVASRDGRAGLAGWTESGGSHAIASSGGIDHHKITGATSTFTYISKSFGISTSTTSWEVQIEWYPGSADGQSSITVYDGTRRVWVYAAATAWRDSTAAGSQIADLDPVNNWNTLTIRRVGEVIELWEGPRRVNLYLYSAMTASGTAASILVGDQVSDTTSRDNLIRSIKARSSGSYNSLPSELFRNTARGR